MCKATQVEIRGFHASESEWKTKDKEASFPKKKHNLLPSVENLEFSLSTSNDTCMCPNLQSVTVSF